MGSFAEKNASLKPENVQLLAIKYSAAQWRWNRHLGEPESDLSRRRLSRTVCSLPGHSTTSGSQHHWPSPEPFSPSQGQTAAFILPNCRQCTSHTQSPEASHFPPSQLQSNNTSPSSEKHHVVPSTSMINRNLLTWVQSLSQSGHTPPASLSRYQPPLCSSHRSHKSSPHKVYQLPHTHVSCHRIPSSCTVWSLSQAWQNPSFCQLLFNCSSSSEVICNPSLLTWFLSHASVCGTATLCP